ncbi:MAG: electron transport complex subunit RsxB [Gammaproteobacteria bacterium]
MTSVLVIFLFAVAIGILILNNIQSSSGQSEKLINMIDSFLPQTQCGQCNYSGCRPYAIAIARNETDINQCPPGGTITINMLAGLLGREVKPLNSEYGVEKPRQVAFIEEELCIGCVKCINACPVDAIIGARQQMHTVIGQECTGCELCIAPCPVDCIDMLAIETGRRRSSPIQLVSAVGNIL